MSAKTPPGRQLLPLWPSLPDSLPESSYRLDWRRLRPATPIRASASTAAGSPAFPQAARRDRPCRGQGGSCRGGDSRDREPGRAAARRSRRGKAGARGGARRHGQPQRLCALAAAQRAGTAAGARRRAAGVLRAARESAPSSSTTRAESGRRSTSTVASPSSLSSASRSSPARSSPGPTARRADVAAFRGPPLGFFRRAGRDRRLRI